MLSFWLFNYTITGILVKDLTSGYPGSFPNNFLDSHALLSLVKRSTGDNECR